VCPHASAIFSNRDQPTAHMGIDIDDIVGPYVISPRGVHPSR
jgi:hypothetical protein